MSETGERGRASASFLSALLFLFSFVALSPSHLFRRFVAPVRVACLDLTIPPRLFQLREYANRMMRAQLPRDR